MTFVRYYPTFQEKENQKKMIAAEPQKTSTINPIDELHNKAMNLADEAFYAKRKEDLETAQMKYKAAFEYEKAAAMLLINSYETEPSRSVLFRSAACLLLNLPKPNPNDYREAERMVAFGLSGYPPAEIAVELRAAFEEIREKWEVIVQEEENLERDIGVGEG